MKLILVSNFDNDSVDHILLADNVQEEYAEFLCEAYNVRFSSGRSTYYCKVKPNDYKLYKWEP